MQIVWFWDNLEFIGGYYKINNDSGFTINKITNKNYLNTSNNLIIHSYKAFSSDSSILFHNNEFNDTYYFLHFCEPVTNTKWFDKKKKLTKMLIDGRFLIYFNENERPLELRIANDENDTAFSRRRYTIEYIKDSSLPANKIYYEQASENSTEKSRPNLICRFEYEYYSK